MQAQEQPIIDNQETVGSKKKNDHFTKLQSFLLIFGTLIVSLVGGYFISDKYLWDNNGDARLYQQLDHYKEVVSKEPNNSEHRVNLGYTYHLTGNSDEAIKQLRLAIDLDKNNVSAYFNLGLVYNDLERFDDALIQANKAVELEPRDFKGFLLQGMVYRELAKYDKSLAALEKANNLMPATTDVIYEIGRVAEAQGKTKDAEAFYKEALSYDPLYKPASEALNKLSKKD